MLGKLTWKQKSDSGLDLPAGDCAPFVVVGQPTGFSGDPLKDVIDKAVHDAHGLGTDTSVRMNLLQHFVDVDAVAFSSLSFAFLVTRSLAFLGLTGLLSSFS